METHGAISADEASAALESVRHSRARVAWSRYPVWYWITTGASLGAMCYATLLPRWWVLAVAAALVVLQVIVVRAACRARGVCEGWMRSAMTRGEGAALYGPAFVVIFSNTVVSKYVSWSSIVAAVLVCVVFAGTGLILGARSACR